MVRHIVGSAGRQTLSLLRQLRFRGTSLLVVQQAPLRRSFIDGAPGLAQGVRASGAWLQSFNEELVSGN